MSIFNCINCKSSPKNALCQYHQGFVDGQKKKISDTISEKLVEINQILTESRTRSFQASTRINELLAAIKVNNEVIADET